MGMNFREEEIQNLQTWPRGTSNIITGISRTHLVTQPPLFGLNLDARKGSPFVESSCFKRKPAMET